MSTQFDRHKAALQRKLAENQQAREKLAHNAAVLAAQLREGDQAARQRLRQQVGKLADDAGLLAYDLACLEKAFLRVVDTLREEHRDVRGMGGGLGD